MKMSAPNGVYFGYWVRCTIGVTRYGTSWVCPDKRRCAVCSTAEPSAASHTAHVGISRKATLQCAGFLTPRESRVKKKKHVRKKQGGTHSGSVCRTKPESGWLKPRFGWWTGFLLQEHPGCSSQGHHSCWLQVSLPHPG